MDKYHTVNPVIAGLHVRHGGHVGGHEQKHSLLWELNSIFM